jgi:hypothetical protein
MENIVTNFGTKDVTSAGYISTTSNSNSNSENATNINITSYSESAIQDVSFVSYVTSSYSLSSSMTLLASVSFSYDFYLTNIGVESLNGQASFYIQIGNNSINNANVPGTCYSSVNFSFLFPFIPKVTANTPIQVYGSSSQTGVYFHMSLNGFK